MRASNFERRCWGRSNRIGWNGRLGRMGCAVAERAAALVAMVVAVLLGSWCGSGSGSGDGGGDGGGSGVSSCPESAVIAWVVWRVVSVFPQVLSALSGFLWSVKVLWVAPLCVVPGFCGYWVFRRCAGTVRWAWCVVRRSVGIVQALCGYCQVGVVCVLSGDARALPGVPLACEYCQNGTEFIASTCRMCACVLVGASTGR